MNYTEGETLAALIVKGVAGFDDTNTGRGDKWQMLNTGLSDHYAILRKGETTRTNVSLRFIEAKNRTIIEVIQRARTSSTVDYDALLEHVQNITTRFDTYRRLSDDGTTVFDANITGSSEVLGVWTNKGDLPSWYKVDLYLDWMEQESITYA